MYQIHGAMFCATLFRYTTILHAILRYYNISKLLTNDLTVATEVKMYVRVTLVNNFCSFCPLCAATNRLIHVCAPVLPAQPESAAAQDSRAVLLSPIVGAPAQNGTLSSSHASPEQFFHPRRIHVSKPAVKYLRPNFSV